MVRAVDREASCRRAAPRRAIAQVDAPRDDRSLRYGSGVFYVVVILAALAMGLQSAYLRRVSGASVHTTFITGMLTALAEAGVAYYRDRGYIRTVVGVPEVKVLGDSDDKKTRWIELRIPITEGRRYVVGTYEVAGNTVLKPEALNPLFEPGGSRSASDASPPSAATRSTRGVVCPVVRLP